MLPMKTTTRLPEPLAHLRRLVLMACLAALVGCGPGTGGTGTGPGGSFIVGPAGGGTTVVAGSPLVIGPRSACIRDCGTTRLKLETASVTLSSSCLRFTRADTWSMDDQRVAVVGGTLEITSSTGTRTVHGTLRLAFGPESEAVTTVTVTLLDDAGGAVLGPLSMVRSETDTANPAVPCVQ
jgi:hypothetical protein